MRTALLVEDDDAISRLVGAVAQDVGVRLVQVGRLDAAHAAVSRNAFDVLLADLMLPDGSGVDWLEREAADGILADTCVVTFSAGVSPDVRTRLGALGVRAFLTKPVAVSLLARWLAPEATGGWAGDGNPRAGAIPPGRAWRSAHHPSGDDVAMPSGACEAVTQWFEGDQTLYDSFRSACRARAVSDQRQGDALLNQGDLPALGRLAHSLKSALRLLGEPALAEQAHALERLCMQATPGAQHIRAWRHLSTAWGQWAAQAAPGR